MAEATVVRQNDVTVTLYVYKSKQQYTKKTSVTK